MHLFLYPVLFVSSLFAEKKIVSLGLVLAMLTMLPSQPYAEEADKNPAAESTQQAASSDGKPAAEEKAGTGAQDGAQAEQEQNKEQTEAQDKDQTEAAAEELADKISEEKLYPQDVRDLWPQLRELVTSPYGAKRSSPGRGSHVHTGLDIRAHIGWPIRSLQKGVVTEAGMNGPAGLMVQVQQEDGKLVTYAHMSEILASKGDEVSRGQHIGRVGCTGRTSGAHLHIAIKDASGRHINPRKEINGLWEVFDPPVEELSGPIESMACTPRERMKGGQANKRLIGTEHYLRMRKALPKKTRISLPEGSY
ncbi:MAG: peptidoglycan DD-metalloendopeptidase family protein [Desulfovibrionaceae bacterium]|nr:peptidoglycan DD-metalloendopeptidase family protein [Desulfovibrionaceae bacterium]